ncbi:hypothetical protein FRC10_006525 [Ceratobasidium sp. 414]|nr:hypothetical protein FRC10_006525 [Ceratobasidium sp. 414]
MLDGQTHLVKQGWKGAGHPLKAGGRTRPIIIAQKKTLGGIGRDRDESFAFWDHLYDVAAKSIKFKIPAEDAESSSEQEEAPTQAIITQEALALDSESTDSGEVIESTALPITRAAASPPTSTTSPSAGFLESGATQPPNNEKQARKAEKAVRKQARAERREAKAMHRAARAEKKARKAEEAARKATKLKKKAEKENRKRLRVGPATEEPAVEQEDTAATAEKAPPPMGGERRKKDRKRKVR